MKYYFDYAAATPVSDSVLAAMRPYFSELFYNPSALYLAAQDVKKAITAARQTVAQDLGAKPSEIIFTAGGTEANNLAINGVMQKFPGANCVVSAVEHDAVMEPASQYDRRIAPVKPDGRVDLEQLENLIDDNTVLISIMYANNELGTIQPIHEIAKIVEQKRSKRNNSLPLYLHTDACQATNYLQILVNTLGVDLMSLNGGKIYGPKQSGALYVRTGTQIHAQVMGGGQERGMRSGTENVPAIIGFATALEETSNIRKTEQNRLRGLLDQAVSRLKTEVPEVIINGSLEYRLPNNLHLTVPGADNERLMMELDERGIMVATGSACSASSDEPSHVLKAIDLSDELARSSLRISFGRQTDEDAVNKLIDALVSLIASS